MLREERKDEPARWLVMLLLVFLSLPFYFSRFCSHCSDDLLYISGLNAWLCSFTRVLLIVVELFWTHCASSWVFYTRNNSIHCVGDMNVKFGAWLLRRTRLKCTLNGESKASIVLCRLIAPANYKTIHHVSLRLKFGDVLKQLYSWSRIFLVKKNTDMPEASNMLVARK